MIPLNFSLSLIDCSYNCFRLTDDAALILPQFLSFTSPITNHLFLVLLLGIRGERESAPSRGTLEDDVLIIFS